MKLQIILRLIDGAVEADYLNANNEQKNSTKYGKIKYFMELRVLSVYNNQNITTILNDNFQIRI
jgi:hypothetical protein